MRLEGEWSLQGEWRNMSEGMRRTLAKVKLVAVSAVVASFCA